MTTSLGQRKSPRLRALVGLVALAVASLSFDGEVAFSNDDYERSLTSSSYQDVNDDVYIVEDEIPDFNSPYSLSDGDKD